MHHIYLNFFLPICQILKSIKIYYPSLSSSTASWISEIKHHRHWQPVLEHIAGCKFSNLTFTLPQTGTILGGTISLHGKNLTLACFHGINFRCKSWALFTMEEPIISFSTESQDIQNDGRTNFCRCEKNFVIYI